MEKIVKVGQLPGRIQEFVVEDTTTVKQLLDMAGLSADGFETKVDGNLVTDFNQPIGSGNLVLLAQRVKGNTERTIKVGQLPGRIQEFAVEDSTSVQALLDMAELNPDGFEVKLDGNKVTDFSKPVGSTNLVLLSKMIKGN